MEQEQKTYLHPLVFVVMIAAFGLGLIGGLLFSPQLDMLGAQEITLTQVPTVEPTQTLIPQFSSEDYQSTANAYYANGDFELATHYYTYAIAQNPNDITPYLNRGLSYAQMQLLPLASQDYEQALELGAEYVQVSPYYDHLGKVAVQQGAYSAALTYLYRSAELMPTRYQPYYELAQLYDALGYTEVAEDYYAIVINLSPETGHNILIQQGTEFYQVGAIADAIDHFTTALTLIPTSSIAHRYRARCYYDLGFSDLALDDLLTALEFNPADPTIYHDLGWYYIQQGDTYLANEYVIHAQQLQASG